MVRDRITLKQREIAKKNSIVIDGRDSGTIVFPNASIKFFLTASIDERTRRRMNDLKTSDFDKVKNDILARDKMDMERQESPLVKAEDAIFIDTTLLDINDVVQKLLVFIGEKN